MSTPKNLDELLSDVYRRRVALRDDDFKNYYNLFSDAFRDLHLRMKAVDPYYRRYSGRNEFAGSHSDRTRIGMPNEFDVDIVIGLPAGVTAALELRPQAPGHLLIKGGTQLLSSSSHDAVDRKVNEWFDDDGYLMRTKFMDWFKSVVARAIAPAATTPTPTFGFGYSSNARVAPEQERRQESPARFFLGMRQSGPAVTLTIRDRNGVSLDVDLVPALTFPESRWPPALGYTRIPKEWSTGSWLVVAKGARGRREAEKDAGRGWRVVLIAQEKRILHDTEHLRQSIRLMKKLRDSLKMDFIASYYIKTLFLWETQQQTSKKYDYWNQSDAVIFTDMVRRLHKALGERFIPYFWNKGDNLIGHVHSQALHDSQIRLSKLVEVLDNSKVSLETVAQFLLTPKEYSKDYPRGIKY